MNEENTPATPVAPAPAEPSPAPAASATPPPASPPAGGEAKGDFAKDLLARIGAKLPSALFPSALKLRGDAAWMAAAAAVAATWILWTLCTSKAVAIGMIVAAVAAVYLALLAAKRPPEKPKPFVPWVVLFCLVSGISGFAMSVRLMSAIGDLEAAGKAAQDALAGLSSGAGGDDADAPKKKPSPKEEARARKGAEEAAMSFVKCMARKDFKGAEKFVCTGDAESMQFWYEFKQHDDPDDNPFLGLLLRSEFEPFRHELLGTTFGENKPSVAMEYQDFRVATLKTWNRDAPDRGKSIWDLTCLAVYQIDGEWKVVPVPVPLPAEVVDKLMTPEQRAAREKAIAAEEIKKAKPAEDVVMAFLGLMDKKDHKGAEKLVAVEDDEVAELWETILGREDDDGKAYDDGDAYEPFHEAKFAPVLREASQRMAEKRPKAAQDMRVVAIKHWSKNMPGDWDLFFVPAVLLNGKWKVVPLPFPAQVDLDEYRTPAEREALAGFKAFVGHGEKLVSALVRTNKDREAADRKPIWPKKGGGAVGPKSKPEHYDDIASFFRALRRLEVVSGVSAADWRGWSLLGGAGTAESDRIPLLFSANLSVSQADFDAFDPARPKSWAKKAKGPCAVVVRRDGTAETIPAAKLTDKAFFGGADGGADRFSVLPGDPLPDEELEKFEALFR